MSDNRARHPKPPNTDRSANAAATKAKAEAKAKAAAAAAAGGKPDAPRPAPPTKSAAKAAPPEPVGPPSFLHARGLAKDYGDLPALKPLDLRVEHGESVVLIGHNGSGKTTFLRMVAGLLEPTGGIVTIDSTPPGSLTARAAVSWLSDSPTFYEDLSVWEHLEYVARLHGVAEWEQHAADLLGHLGLYDRADDLPVTFSRGLKQKAAIAIAFVRPFELLLVDEPFVGLDATGKSALLDLLDGAKAEGATLVVATHELAFVERVSRCVALRDGGLVHDGPTSGIDVLSLVS